MHCFFDEKMCKRKGAKAERLVGPAFLSVRPSISFIAVAQPNPVPTFPIDKSWTRLRVFPMPGAEDSTITNIDIMQEVAEVWLTPDATLLGDDNRITFVALGGWWVWHRDWLLLGGYHTLFEERLRTACFRFRWIQATWRTKRNNYQDC